MCLVRLELLRPSFINTTKHWRRKPKLKPTLLFALETGSNPAPATPSSFSRIHPTLLIEPQRPKEWLLTPISLHPDKEDIQGNLLLRTPPFRIAVDIQILRERDLPFSQFWF